MGGGTWTTSAYTAHSTSARGFASMDAFLSSSTQDLYRATKLESCLNPYNVIRECVDSDEHPNTIPVILALDVTGSMGSAAEAIAKQLNDIMTEIYKSVQDVEFCIMAIGDMSYDISPVQASQFESDIRIAEQLEKVYFERGGGGNQWESYTAAWYFGLYHTKLDCWNRGKKGIIITMGDEPLNPYLPRSVVNRVFGDNVQADVDTKELYDAVTDRFDIYHIATNDNRTAYRHYANKIADSWGKLLGQHLVISDCNNLYKTIADIVTNSANSEMAVGGEVKVTNEGINW